MTPAGWSLGVWIGGPVVVVLTLVCVASIITARLTLRRSNDSDDRELGCGAMIAAGLILVITWAVALVSYWPLDPSFHRWYHVTGTVQAIGSRQIADGHAMSTRYVFSIDGQAFGVDDTRASLVKVGDRVSLMCKKEYVFRSVSGWACNWD